LAAARASWTRTAAFPLQDVNRGRVDRLFLVQKPDRLIRDDSVSLRLSAAKLDGLSTQVLVGVNEGLKQPEPL
jgi:hypothetical protein